MKIRADVHVDGTTSKVLLAARPEEKQDHLALKLAMVTMLRPMEPVVDPSPSHPALSGFEFCPDVFVLDETGAVAIWVECGAVSLHKLDKVSRRLPTSRLIVLKATRREAAQLRDFVRGGIKYHERVEIWFWPDGKFAEWMSAVREKTELFGEAHEKFLNVVVNEVPMAVEFESI